MRWVVTLGGDHQTWIKTNKVISYWRCPFAVPLCTASSYWKFEDCTFFSAWTVPFLAPSSFSETIFHTQIWPSWLLSQFFRSGFEKYSEKSETNVLFILNYSNQVLCCANCIVNSYCNNFLSIKRFIFELLKIEETEESSYTSHQGTYLIISVLSPKMPFSSKELEHSHFYIISERRTQQSPSFIIRGM